MKFVKKKMVKFKMIIKNNNFFRGFCSTFHSLLILVPFTWIFWGGNLKTLEATGNEATCHVFECLNVSRDETCQLFVSRAPG